MCESVPQTSDEINHIVLCYQC